MTDDEDSADLLMWAARQIANAALPPPVLAGIRLGKIVALQKTDGGVRGLVMSDAFHRVVARTLAQQYAGAFQSARARAVPVCLAGSRGLLPFVVPFYAEPSTYVFYDAQGAVHEIRQGEGGEQGDPLMPALCALGQHAALPQAHTALGPGEDLYAYLDDVYVTSEPERAGPIFEALGGALWERANVRVHLGKTRAWNAAGEEPSTLLDRLPAAARADA